MYACAQVYERSQAMDELDTYWPTHAELTTPDEEIQENGHEVIVPVTHFQRAGPHSVVS